MAYAASMSNSVYSGGMAGGSNPIPRPSAAAGAANVLKLAVCGGRQLHVPLLWFAIAAATALAGRRAFYHLMMAMFAMSALTDPRSGCYHGCAVFLLMALTLARGKAARAAATAEAAAISVVRCAAVGMNIMNMLAVAIELAFALFCYYGFLRVEAGRHEKDEELVCTDKERSVLRALATQDKSQKEVMYELGVSPADMARTLAAARKRNRIETNDMLVRRFAIELHDKEMSG